MNRTLTYRCREGENAGKPGPCPLAQSAPAKKSPRSSHQSRAIWGALVRKAGGLTAGAKIAVARMGQAAWDRLPGKAQRVLARTWAAAKSVEHRGLMGFHKVREMVEATARERGYSEQTAHRVARVVGAVDMLSAWTVSPAVGYTVGGAVGAKVAAWTPVFGLAFMTASAATNPIATYRAAKKVLLGQSQITRKSRMASPDTVAMCLEFLSGVDVEWREALLYAALDLTRGDLGKALGLVGASADDGASETEKCMEGENAHKPGPCPDENGNEVKPLSSSHVDANKEVAVDVRKYTVGAALEAASNQYPKAGKTIDGLEVVKKVDNRDSIASSLDHYEVLPGIRQIAMSDFHAIGERRAKGEIERRSSADDERRVEELVAKIKSSKRISALIVVDDGHPDGPYVLEGGHRFDALERLGAESFPALVVLDFDGIGARVRSGKLTPRLVPGKRAENDSEKSGLELTIKSATNGGTISNPRLGDDRERIELIADILGGLFGDKALLAFEDMESGSTEKSYGISWLTAKAWEELDHPRGKGGRFIKKGSAEAVAAATVAIRSALRSKPEALGPEHAKKLAEHLSILTVKQLRQLKKEHGLRANGRVRGRLVHALTEHLPGVKDRIDKLKEEARAKREEHGRQTGAGGNERGVASPGEKPPTTGGGVAAEAPRSGAAGNGEERAAANQPAGAKASARVPANRDEVMRRLDRFQNLFRSRGNHQAVEFLDVLRNHVGEVGTDKALESLGVEGGKGDNEGTTYEGEKAGWEDMSAFGKAYLERYGITSVYDTGIGSGRVVSSLSRAFGGEGGKGHKGDFQPIDPTLNDKLEESKKLPGLETSEDLGVIMGKPVTHLTQEVQDKMDERYGKGQWIVKTYGDYAFAGNGIFFPQRAEQIRRDARANLWDAGSHLARYGFSHLRDKDGKVIGIKHQGGDEYRFGTEKYEHTIHGDARHWGDVSAAAAANEQGAELPFGGKDFMAQPAFPVVGITNEERAQGITFKRGQEGRTHIVTRNGKAELIPHTTWLKMEPLPVVFEDADTRAMAQAAVDAINALPESEKQGQVYAPDIVRTADGYRVVEANPSNYSGPSGYLGDNPLIIDSYVSHLTGREPAHVQFIRKLLTKKAS